MHRNYRKCGPSTSAMAGRHVRACGCAQRLRDLCLRVVTRQPGMTAREIEARLGIKAHKRLPELRADGLVHNGSIRTCRVSGRMAMTWQPDSFIHEAFNTGDHA